MLKFLIFRNAAVVHISIGVIWRKSGLYLNHPCLLRRRQEFLFFSLPSTCARPLVHIKIYEIPAPHVSAFICKY